MTKNMIKSYAFDTRNNVISKPSSYLFTYLISYIHFQNGNLFEYTKSTPVYIETFLLPISQKEPFLRRNVHIRSKGVNVDQ